MPRPPPRPLCLPELVVNPQLRAEYVQAHPPIHAPYASTSRTGSSHYSNSPPSPSSTTDINSHRASGATLASLGSTPVTPASTHTSLSVHNAPWINDLSKRLSASTGGLMPTLRGAEEAKALPGPTAGNKLPRTSWSSALASTKSWFGAPAATQDKQTSLTAEKKSSQKEIKLSPSMIAAYAEMSSSPRPLSYVSEPPALSPTSSTLSSCRIPRVGSGLRYYTERNPAPIQARVQIPDPINLLDHDPSRPTSLPNNYDSNGLTTFAGLSRLQKDTTLPRNLDVPGLNDEDASRGEAQGLPSPLPSHPANVRDSDVPDIRVSSGDDL